MKIIRSYQPPVLLLLPILAVLTGCSHLPVNPNRPASHALTDTADTRLGRAIAPQAAAHAGQSGIIGVGIGRDAFAVRALLAEAAERSIDAQYYIWKDDLSGTLLFGSLQRAAERGVRVRLLLDDNNTSPALDTLIAALDAHPNIEVRLFNPFLQRSARFWGFLTDFSRLNRRMHNKSFTVDGQATVVGGRNIGDEYFEAHDDTTFIDLDVLAVGPVVQEVEDDFDRYWTCSSAYPASSLLTEATEKTLITVKATIAKAEASPAAEEYKTALARGPLLRELMAGRLNLEWTRVQMVSDDPAKGLGLAEKPKLLSQRSRQIIGQPANEFLIVSPYFVPTRAGAAHLAQLARQGVQVSVLTNSLAATDVAAVHAGYAKHRRELLRAGVRLFELKSTAVGQGAWKLTGRSAASLHAKTFAVDRSRIFVGSFNFDPRSDHLNTEIGFIIDSPAGATRLSQLFKGSLASVAYQVQIDADDDLVWAEKTDGGTKIFRSEPATGLGRRLIVKLLSWLPIERLL